MQDYRTTAAAKHAAWLKKSQDIPHTESPAPPPPSSAVASQSPPNGVETKSESLRYIYVLLCSGGKYYVGETHNVEERFAQHLNAHTTTSSGGTSTVIPGAAWTKRYEPIEVVKKFVKQSVHDEDNTTLDYMVEHGIRNVRGGSFCMVKLPRHVRRTIKQQLATIQKLCYRCKRPNHCANNCPSGPSGPSGPPLLPSHKQQHRSWIDYDSEEETQNHTQTNTNTTTTPAATPNPLFTFDSTDDVKDEKDDRLRPPKPQSEPECLTDIFPTPSQRQQQPLPLRSGVLRYNPSMMTTPTPIVVCTRCGRNNHTNVQCFAKLHLKGHILPPK